MKVSEKWLREWVNLDGKTSEEIEHQLIMSGTELDGVDSVASAFTHVVTGQIKSLEQHLDADRLTVCQVDVGADELIQIVTNASVAQDQKVPVAMIGANLPDEQGKPFKIKKSKLRGESSQGMFCGAETLGLSGAIAEKSGEGLLIIPDDAPLGTDLREIYDFSDVVLDLDSTPNRADLLSVSGIARELGVIMQTAVTLWPIEKTEVTHDTNFPVKISCDDLCQRYVGRIIQNVNTQAQTPDWMVDKLACSDIRSLGPVVDVTNFVMLELGQPMHGFDFDKLVGGIEVRNAQEGEKLTLLDGKEATLRSDTMVIADQNKALALAGIMGGEASSVGDSTKNIYLESAFFVPNKIMGKARTYGLHTDSSHRFERGVSPDLQVKALERATHLILSICGGSAGPITDVISNEALQTQSTINFKRSQIKRHLGIEVDDARVVDILERLECKLEADFVDKGNEGWKVSPPIFRFDLATPEDLVEEIARIYGYDNIPAVLRPMKPLIALPSEEQVRESTLQNILVERGYQEAITYSFVPSEIEGLLAPDQQQIKLSNPISEELSIMRSTLWSGLIPALDKNVKRQQSRVRLFESGLTFVKSDSGLPEQRKKMAAVITGALHSEQWSKPSRDVDFYDLKGDVEAILAEASAQQFSFEKVDHLALHPGQSAAIICNGKQVGILGALHPNLEKKLSLDQTVFVFEIDLDLISKKKLPAYVGLSPYPSVRRDLALLVNQEISYAQIDKVLKNSQIDALLENFVFDVYEGENVESGQKSLALGLIFQDFSRTLEEQEISTSIEKIVSALKQEVGAVLR